MSKLSYEDKINLCHDYKEGSSINTLSRKYNKRESGITYLIKLIDIHGFDVVKTSRNKSYPITFKQDAIDRVLLNKEPVWSVSLDIGLSSDGMLQNWIKKYKENG